MSCQIRFEKLPNLSPHPQPLSQAWERGAGAIGDGGVRSRDFDRKRRVCEADFSVNDHPRKRCSVAAKLAIANLPNR
ncbi:hypothetical protein C7B77_10420 [Chamaesiphon polymorphus CCALA 037]|uniref:Uncharacterized protein n=1 Tax=Chamaesiphon polymorphus CCALA 037 TaxID=2107692 RepID=A0A2T1GGQ0_9CYAN|nr:hypothetical protein C7B77_10420 [Chamaesiphon polymorphus CCALA 037]